MQQVADRKGTRKGRLFKRCRPGGGEYPEWHGRVQQASGTWRTVKLFTDLEVSRRKLGELQKLADLRREGYSTVEHERLKLPLADLVAEYVASLKGRRLDADHVDITDKMLGRVVAVGGLRTFADITVASVERALPLLAPKTVSYQNCYVKKIKALVHWALPEGMPDPLRKLRRRRERGATRNRARRALSLGEQRAFSATWAKLPWYRHVAYALAMLNGLRRSNIRGLRWGDVALSAPVPFIKLQQKMGDGHDVIALHPYVVGLLQSVTPGMPLTKVVPAVPDVSTLVKELGPAGVQFVNAAGERADFHGLRHTFATTLDATGCSRATKKRLLRHAAEDVTDGYAHAELAEMLAALERVPSPAEELVAESLTGTDGKLARLAPLLRHGNRASVHDAARSCTIDPERVSSASAVGHVGHSPVAAASGTPLHDAARPCLPEFPQAGTVPNPRPDTQVD